MLILNRRRNEKITIKRGDEVLGEITVCGVKGDKVKIGCVGDALTFVRNEVEAREQCSESSTQSR